MRPTVNLSSIQKVYRGLFPLLEQWLFPGFCTLCDAQGMGRLDLCEGCLADLPWNQHACLQCASPLPDQTAVTLCGACLHPRHKAAYDQVWAAFIYSDPLPWLITQLKFHDRLNHARLLSHLLWQRLEAPLLHHSESRPDVIMPVPLHPKRLRERGFNQALEIARPIAKKSGIPLNKKSLRRTKATDRQSDLNLKERQRNLREAFTCDTAVHGQHVVLIDDVMTSGSTLNAAALALKKAGAVKVSAWVAARAVSHAI